MSEAQLNILNYALLALLYLFFGRVLWAVWSEVRGPRVGTPPNAQPAAAVAAPRTTTSDATAPSPRPPAPAQAPVPAKALRAKRGVPSRLVVLEPKVRKGAAYPIGHELTLGRAQSCGVRLPDDTFASQLHARLYARDAVIWLEDLGSTNGTHLNGARVTAPVQMATGDRVQVGSTIFEAQ